MNRSGDIYQRLDELEDKIQWEKDYLKRNGERISDLENNVGWIMFAIKAAAAVYCARRLQIWWIKSIREEVGEE